MNRIFGNLISAVVCCHAATVVRGVLATIACGMLLAPQDSRAEEVTAPDLLPSTTVLYAEAALTPERIEALVDHPLRAKLEALDPIRAAFEKKGFQDFKRIVAMIEAKVQMPWRKILAEGTGGGVTVAVDAKSQGAALLIRSRDEALPGQLLEAAITLTRFEATRKGEADPVKEADYRGLKAFRIRDARIVLCGPWFTLCNKDDLAKSIADAYLDHPGESSLAKNAVFQQARSAAPEKAWAWGWAHIAVLRDAGVAKDLYSGRAENALAELLFGGILDSLKHTPYATAAVLAKPREVTLQFAVPHDRSWAGETREYFFGPGGTGAAPPQLNVPEALLTLQSYRDISGMWVRAGDLFDEKTNDELAKADSNLSTLFGGKDFGEDILGSFGPEMHLVVTPQKFAEGSPQPAIKLPAFAFVFRLKDPAKMQPELRRTYQSLIGFLNIVGAMNGQPQLEQDIEKTADTQVLTATYLTDSKDTNPTGQKIHHNFSPSVAFAGERMVISSTKELARQLVAAQPEKPAAADAASNGTVANTVVGLSFDALKTVLVENREQLIAQNMLQEGHTRAEAETAIDLLLELVGWFDQAAMRLDSTDNQLRFSMSVSVDE